MPIVPQASVMRHSTLAGTIHQGRELLARAPHVHLATTTPDGLPVLRALNAALVEDFVLFHGAKAGEKSSCLGRIAVVSAVEEVAFIPSHFTNAHNACPATTLFRSVQASGRLQDIQDLDVKAKMLTALMTKYQPEGGYAPIDPNTPEYRGEVKGVRVFGLKIQSLKTKLKLAQNKPEEVRNRLIAGLKRRNAPGDAAAIEAILDASSW